MKWHEWGYRGLNHRMSRMGHGTGETGVSPVQVQEPWAGFAIHGQSIRMWTGGAASHPIVVPLQE